MRVTLAGARVRRPKIGVGVQLNGLIAISQQHRTAGRRDASGVVSADVPVSDNGMLMRRQLRRGEGVIGGLTAVIVRSGSGHRRRHLVRSSSRRKGKNAARTDDVRVPEVWNVEFSRTGICIEYSSITRKKDRVARTQYFAPIERQLV